MKRTFESIRLAKFASLKVGSSELVVGGGVTVDNITQGGNGTMGGVNYSFTRDEYVSYNGQRYFRSYNADNKMMTAFPLK